MMLFLLCAILPFLGPSRTSWGARIPVFLLSIAAAFTHPTTCVIYGVVLMAVFGWHFLTSRFSLGSALRSDGPMLMAAGFGMIAGLAMWVVGIWGPAAKLSDAALPPPYTKEFFLARLGQWVGSLQPLIIGPLIVVAVVSTILMARRERKPAGTYEIVSIWWMLPFLGCFTFLTSAVVPYYRFMNATGGASCRSPRSARSWRSAGSSADGAKRAAGILASVAIVGALGWVFSDGLSNRWASEKAQWIDEGARISLAAVHEVAAEAGVRPNVFIANFGDTATAYGWAKTFTNIMRTGLPGDLAQYSATYFGTRENYLAGQPTVGEDEGYTQTSKDYFEEVQAQAARYTDEPVVFLVGQFYKGDVDVEQALVSGVSIGPGRQRDHGRRPVHADPRGRGGGAGGRGRREGAPGRSPGSARQPAAYAPRAGGLVLPGRAARVHRVQLVRAGGHAQQDRADPGDLDLPHLAVRDRSARGLAWPAHHDQGVGGRGARHPRGARFPVRGAAPRSGCSGRSAGSSTTCSASSPTRRSRRLWACSTWCRPARA